MNGIRLARVGAAVALAVAIAGGFAAPASAAQLDDPIVGGVPAPTNAYPWMVSISRPGVFSHWCGGTLIAPNWVLTAAHCVEGLSASNFSTLIGQSQLSGGTGGETRSVAEIRIHPFWNTSTMEYDAALLRLTTSSSKTPVQTVSSAERDLWMPNTTVRTMGWGDTSEGGSSSNTLRQVDVPVQSDATMTSSSAYGSRFKPGSMLGAGPLAGGQDSCQGDSGGPLLTSTPRGWRQIGVVSWGDGCARPNKPGIYTRLGEQVFDDFIRGNVPASVADGFSSRSGDFNGDGRDDIIRFNRGSLGDAFVSLSNGSSFGASVKWHDNFTFGQEIPMIGNFNGDSRDDILVFSRTGQAYVALSNGSSFVGTAVLWHNAFCFGNEVCAVGDVNGDNRTDILVFNRGNAGDVWVALSNGSSFGAVQKWHDNFGFGSEIPMLGDFNGDNRDDIIVFNRGGTGDAWVGLSNGVSFGAPVKWHDNFTFGGEIPAIGNFNGDTRDDIVVFTRGGSGDAYVALSNGLSFVGTGVRWHDNFTFGSEIPGVGDFTGDGRDDVVVYTRGSAADVYVATSNGSSFVGTAVLWHGNFAPNAEIPLGASLW